MKKILFFIFLFLFSIPRAYARENETMYKIVYKIGGPGIDADINDQGQVAAIDAGPWTAHFWDTDHLKTELVDFEPADPCDTYYHGVNGKIAISESGLIIGWHACEYFYNYPEPKTHSEYFMWDKDNGLTREIDSAKQYDYEVFDFVTNSVAGFTRVTNTDSDITMDELNALTINKQDFLGGENNAEYTFLKIQDINSSGQMIVEGYLSDRPYSSDEWPQTYFMLEPHLVPEPASIFLFGIGAAVFFKKKFVSKIRGRPAV